MYLRLRDLDFLSPGLFSRRRPGQPSLGPRRCHLFLQPPHWRVPFPPLRSVMWSEKQEGHHVGNELELELNHHIKNAYLILFSCDGSWARGWDSRVWRPMAAGSTPTGTRGTSASSGCQILFQTPASLPPCPGALTSTGLMLSVLTVAT